MTLDLFHNDNFEPERIDLPDAELLFWPQFYSMPDAHDWFERLMKSVAWEEKFIAMYGRQVAVPRLSAWYADTHKNYTYSGNLHTAMKWTSELLSLKQSLEHRTGEKYNSVLCNLYRDGQDSVAWHSDDEPELGKEPAIASLSFGETRIFKLRRADDHKQKFDIELPSGSCLLMRGKTQQAWQHQIAKSKKPLQARINLTFRLIS